MLTFHMQQGELETKGIIDYSETHQNIELTNYVFTDKDDLNQVIPDVFPKNYELVDYHEIMDHKELETLSRLNEVVVEKYIQKLEPVSDLQKLEILLEHIHKETKQKNIDEYTKLDQKVEEEWNTKSYMYKKVTYLSYAILFKRDQIYDKRNDKEIIA